MEPRDDLIAVKIARVFPEWLRSPGIRAGGRCQLSAPLGPRRAELFPVLRSWENAARSCTASFLFLQNPAVPERIQANPFFSPSRELLLNVGMGIMGFKSHGRGISAEPELGSGLGGKFSWWCLCPIPTPAVFLGVEFLSFLHPTAEVQPLAHC